MKLIFLASVMAILVALVKCNDLQVGNSVGAQLAFMDNVKLGSVPFTTRTKNVFYNNERNQPIKAITATDLDKTKAQATVTSGGVGSTFVNIRLKGERGEALNYQIMIFA